MELHYSFSIFNSSRMCFNCNVRINIACFGVHPINQNVSNFLPVELSSKFQIILLYKFTVRIYTEQDNINGCSQHSYRRTKTTGYLNTSGLSFRIPFNLL